MSVDGTWNISMETPLGTRNASLSLASSGSTLTGTMSGGGGSIAIRDGSANGDAVAFKVDISNPMPMTLEFSATVAGDAISGSVKLGMFGDAPVSGTRG